MNKQIRYSPEWPGRRYLSIHYTKRLAAAGLKASVGDTGDSYDNALAATINGLYKTEVILSAQFPAHS